MKQLIILSINDTILFNRKNFSLHVAQNDLKIKANITRNFETFKEVHATFADNSHLTIVEHTVEPLFFTPVNSVSSGGRIHI